MAEYQVGDFSKITRLSIRTLHYYHEMGLLLPTRTDEWTGYRYYDEKSVEKARLIWELKELDFSLKEVKEILENFQNDDEIGAYLARKSREIGEKIAAYAGIREKLNLIMKKGEENKMVDNKKQEVLVKELPDLLIVSERFKGKYEDVGRAFGRLYRIGGSAAGGAAFSLYYDKDYKEEQADIEACVPVKREISKDGVQSRLLPGGRAVCLIHHGPYEKIGESYQVVFDYLAQNGYSAQSPSREVYLKGPGMVFRGDPEKYLTEIQVLID